MTERNSEAKHASESGEVILMPYVFSMMFLPSALQKKARGQNALFSWIEEKDASRRALSNGTDVIFGTDEELLEE